MKIKDVFFVTNATFLFAGTFVLTIGLKPLQTISNFDLFLEWYYFTPAKLLTVSGVGVILVVAMGLVAAFRESEKLLKLYVYLMIFIINLEIFAGTGAFFLKKSIPNHTIKDNLINTFQNYSKKLNETKTWNFMQENLRCCGVEQPSDWARANSCGHSVAIDGQIFSVPLSCCNNDQNFCAGIYNSGCLQELGRYVVKSSVWIGCTAFIGISVELIPTSIAILLLEELRRLKIEREMLNA